MYTLHLAADEDLKCWDQTISRCPYSEALHTIEWRNALDTSFRQLHPIYYLIRDESGDVAGALPCFVFKPVPMVSMLASMPWNLPGGPLLFPDADVQAATLAVVNKLDALSREWRTSETVINLMPTCDPEIADDMGAAGSFAKTKHFTHILETDREFDEIWRSYNKRVRGAVRKAEKSGVVVRESEDEGDMIEFYRLYMNLMSHFKGTPKPYRLLRFLQTSSIGRLVIAELDNKVIGGLLFLHFGSAVRLWCEASDPVFLKYRPNNAIINYIIRWACERNFPYVDFGASPPESKGLIAFKEEWRAREVWFPTLTRADSRWRRKVWTVSEPSLRSIYAAIQKLRLRSV